MSSFLYRSHNNTILIPRSAIELCCCIASQKCEFVKLFVAAPKQKFQLVRSLSIKTMLSTPDEFIALAPAEGLKELQEQQSVIFLKIKLFSSTNHPKAFAEQTLLGTFDVQNYIVEIVESLSRSTSLRKLLIEV